MLVEIGGTSPLRQYAGIAEEPAKLYIGFCPECKDEAAVLSQGIDELRSSGRLQTLLKDYYLSK